MEREMVDIEAAESMATGLHAELFQNDNPPVRLKFQDVVYKIHVRVEGCLKKKNQKKAENREKIILKGISGVVSPGEILAMLGPSGSGKTTLLTALGGRLGGALTGSITYNGRPFSSLMNRDTGFVTQDDALYPHLTVTETLVYTALLRLPKALTKEEKIRQAESVITQLGLTSCKDGVIGDHLVRGISGGERKRVSIGQEMLINPSLLLLDEPTSGLDSTTAQKIVSALWELANGGKTIVVTIHQPSSRLYHMFHKILLLSEGNPIYFGKSSDAMDYFSAQGFVPVFPMNPADFLLDLANGVRGDESGDDEALVKQTLVSAFKANLARNLELELQELNDNIQEVSNEKNKDQWTTTWWQQFSILLARGVKERRHQTFSGIMTGQILIISFLCGLLWWQSNKSNLQDQIALFFYSTGLWGFFPLSNAIFTFPQERLMLKKERGSGMYRLSSYFMARILGDLPMELIYPTIFVIITYWMAGLKPAPANFFGFLCVLLYSVAVSHGLGLAVGALIMDQQLATVTGSLILLGFLLTGGFFIQNVPKFIAWIKYVSFHQYTFKLLVMSQFRAEDTYPCPGNGNGTCFVQEFPAIKNLGFNGVGVSLAALSVMIVGYRLLAYWALTKIGLPGK